jgi:hypothetical protein
MLAAPAVVVVVVGTIVGAIAAVDTIAVADLLPLGVGARVFVVGIKGMIVMVVVEVVVSRRTQVAVRGHCRTARRAQEAARKGEGRCALCAVCCVLCAVHCCFWLLAAGCCCGYTHRA